MRIFNNVLFGVVVERQVISVLGAFGFGVRHKLEGIGEIVRPTDRTLTACGVRWK